MVAAFALGVVSLLVGAGARVLTLNPPEGQAAAPWLAAMPWMAALLATSMLLVGAGLRAARPTTGGRGKAILLVVAIFVGGALSVVGAVVSAPDFPSSKTREASLTTGDGEVVHLMRSGLICSRSVWVGEGMFWIRPMENSQPLSCEHEARLSEDESGHIQVLDEAGEPIAPAESLGPILPGWN